ncbi:carbon-nitrogen hydrolase family protein [Tautonia sociabilis]|uniref:Carbon-nitrogen hydrolase family protein n=1 Tax=Tautonia sociabilis TaxID=2080755 RepID=A0A432MJT3_9BACT|nr:carbon-nitrogen hydrolase family protein [Tautonia sociabilis]RUL87445.1 carbon-nitrogen hydrolase family protein [Tautonia sociabilis]
MASIRILAAITAAVSISCPEDAPPPTTIRVASVQLRSTRGLDENVDRIREHLLRLGGSGVDVAVFPECALTGYFEDSATAATAEELARAEQRVADACRSAGIAAVVGSPWRQGDRLFNSALVIDASGRVVERYHKVQLAEPWPDPGDHLSVFSLAGVPCSVIICHDERYPELVRLPVLAGARVVFYISHESGIRQERKIGPYRAQIQARAVENTVFVVQANAPANDDLSGSHGQSRVIDPDGTIIAEASMFDEEVLVADLELSRATAANARRSVDRGPLGDWWRQGVDRVRIVGPGESGGDSGRSGAEDPSATLLRAPGGRGG